LPRSSPGRSLTGIRTDALHRLWIFPATLLLLAGVDDSFAAKTFTIATYNVENDIDVRAGTRPAKSEQARSKIRESIRVMNPDVLALQEIGSTNVLLELRSALKEEGLDFPYWELVSGFDTNIHVAVLSKLDITARRPHTHDGFLLNGRRFRLTRGILEIDIQAAPDYSFTLFVAHLKSRRAAAEADEADLREQEALVLREKIDDRLRSNPDANLVVVGDLNDTRDSKSTRAVIGKGKVALVDTRPAEKNGDSEPSSNPHFAPRNVTWTHFYGKEDTYSRLDYILLSRGMAREWEPAGTYVLALSNWGVASDHRPIIARFAAEDR
jgi:endonuclease/exonuclease/phosphatase family metal-dependent hydrolase